MTEASHLPGLSLSARGPKWLFALSACLIVASAGAQTPVTKADAPEIQVGDRWKQERKDRRTGIKESETVRTVTEVGPNSIEGTQNSGRFSITPELNPIETDTMIMTGDPKFLSFPLEARRKWSFTYNYTNKANQSKGRVQLDAEVLSYERVTVPAGTFEAFRIEAKGYWNNLTVGSNGRSKSVYWYAPAARTVVRTEYEDGFNNWISELVEYELQH